jgi:hypothetical protein
VAFVSRMVAESAALGVRADVGAAGCCVWFTSLLGRHTSVPAVVEAARAAGAPTVRVYTLAQGRTWRWVVAWSFLPPSAFLRQGWGFVRVHGDPEPRAPLAKDETAGASDTAAHSPPHAAIAVGSKRPRVADTEGEDGGNDAAGLTTSGLLRVAHHQARAMAPPPTPSPDSPFVAVGLRRLALHVPPAAALLVASPPATCITVAAAEYPAERAALQAGATVAVPAPAETTHPWVATLLARLSAAIASSPGVVDRDAGLRMVVGNTPPLLPAHADGCWVSCRLVEYWREGAGGEGRTGGGGGGGGVESALGLGSKPHLDMAAFVGLLVRPASSSDGGATAVGEQAVVASVVVALLRSDDPNPIVLPSIGGREYDAAASTDVGIADQVDEEACRADCVPQRGPSDTRSLAARWCRLADHVTGTVAATGKRFRRAAHAAASAGSG